MAERKGHFHRRSNGRIKVNMTKVRKDETIPPGKPGIDLLLPEERESKPKSSVPLRIAGKTTPKPAAPHPAENMFVEDLTSVPEQAHWNCVRKGRIHVLEIFAGSGRFSSSKERLLIVT